ncbi:MAG: CDP-diacylglycerol--glycerol-3-phosphate 3-phosphatidyltransferase [Gammaproteobacteria bacterium]|nr:CDP-diacylglycerol--glycerol-3-phosphate 3-phosphatidyltransferase [Gammaproteobacteria bacterium]
MLHIPWTTPNSITILRVLVLPLLVVFFYLPFAWTHLVTAALFVLAALTDWLDGYLARRLSQTSSFGAFLDPVADKLIVIVALVLLIEEQGEGWFTVPALIIIAREVLISALREWMAEKGHRAHVAVSYLGKVKTTVQMIAVTVLLAIPPAPFSFLRGLGIVLLYMSAALTFWSMMHYLRMAWASLKSE